jgi:hypothetical protein
LSGCAGLVPLAVKIRSSRTPSPSRHSLSSGAFVVRRALADRRTLYRRRACYVCLLLPLLLLTGITACASADPGSEADTAERRVVAAGAGRVVITVHNDTRPFDEVTVLLFPGQPGGRQHTLGTVPPGETRSFTYQADDGTHYLLARRVSWSPVARSRSFIMPESGHIEWSTRVGRVRIRDR